MVIRITKKKNVTVPEPAPLVEIPADKVLDNLYQAAAKAAPQAIIPWWLMASYLYYVHDVSMLSDGLYDQMSQDILRDWEELEHKHKHLIPLENLESGSLYTWTADDYPVTTRGAAIHLARYDLGLELSHNRGRT